MGVAACGQAADPTSEPPRPSQAECESLYDTLHDRHTRAVQAWSAECEAARETRRFEEVASRGQEITREFLARFEELAQLGCARAKYEVLDSLGHLEPFDEGRVDAALAFLDDLVRE